MIENLQARHTAECQKLQEEAAAGEKRLLAELEMNYDKLYRELEASLSEKEKTLIGDLQAKHAAERHQIEQAATDREQALLEQLGVARRQLVVVILGAVLSVAAILYFQEGPKDAQSVLPSTSGPAGAPSAAVSPKGSVTAAVPVAAVKPPEAAPTVVAKSAPVVVQVSVKTGNGGNFSGGKSAVK